MTATDDDVDAVGRVEALVDDLVQSYVEHTRPQAMLLVGSGATGEVDGYSDVDLILYHDAVPAVRTREAARATVGAERFEGADWPAEGYSERYDVGGIHCQLGHALIEPWEREIAKVVDELDLDPRLLKQLMGLFEGRPLHGEDLIAGWRRRAAYTPRLQQAMIEKHWRFFPWWYYQDKLRRRDATIWRYDVLVRSSYDLVGIVAALNRVYFSTFEFKRVRAYLERLDVAPTAFADRLERLFVADAEDATLELERLVDETRALVAERLPDLELSIEWAGRATPPGSRERPWT